MTRTRRGTRRAPTELESCVLAIIDRLPDATAYGVRRYLSQSLSSYWSGSAGAIYPLLEKLAKVGWVTFEEVPFGSRRKRTYSLTDGGSDALRRWLAAPVPDGVAAHTYDPIRTRVFFLDRVPPESRAAFLEDAIRQTKRVLDLHRAELNDLGPEAQEWERHGREGAIQELSARLDWLRSIGEPAAD